jgi:hypothetical protein
MSLTLKVKRGYTAVLGVPIDYAALNAGFLPIITLEGQVGATDIAAGAVHAINVTPDAYWYTLDTDAGANVLVCTYTPAPEAFKDGLILACKVNGANTGAVTFDPGLGVKKLFKYKDVELAAGDLKDGMIIEMRYDIAGNAAAGAWQLLTPVATTLDKGTPGAIVGTILTDGGGPLYTVPTPGGVLTVAHHLGIIPALVRVVLVNAVTDLGFAVGDEVGIEAAICDLSASGTYQYNEQAAWLTCADATNVTVPASNWDQGPTFCPFIPKTGGPTPGSSQSITLANWRIKIYVFTLHS